VLVDQPAREVACGESHSLILLQSGELLSCGSNAQGALGHNSVDSKKRCKKPMPIEQVSGLEIDKIACGNRHNLLLTAKGEVYSWGCNKYGQLGHKK
jgi:alpha-tubulin suppressor-like RCC1 family protein